MKFIYILKLQIGQTGHVTNGTNRVFGYAIQKKRKDYSFRRVT